MNTPAPFRFNLTARQRECFDVIEHHIATFQRSPSRRELANLLDAKSPGQVVCLLKALQERGWIAILPNKTRSITIVPEPVTSGYVLSTITEAKLRAHCAITGDQPADVVSDVVALFLDEQEGSVAA